tara:strand:- start:11130 stop:11543 length:414 start_codon:yes stop_codon:yes gene_type:complete
MSEPLDKSKYAKAKAKYKDMKHSAYRSGLIVKEYKRLGGTYSGKKKEKKGLSRWFKEKWESQSGNKVYKKKGDIFRPTKRITKDTPTTMKELTPAQKKRAMNEKKKKGRVSKFDKDKEESPNTKSIKENLKNKNKKY